MKKKLTRAFKFSKLLFKKKLTRALKFSKAFLKLKLIIPDFQSSSPPRKDASLYTPSSGQKRFNPFMKNSGSNSNSTGKMNIQDDDSRTNTSPTHKKPLTPTKYHPLMDVNTKATGDEFMESDSEENINEVVVDKRDDAVVESSELKIMHDDLKVNVDENSIKNSQISNPTPSFSQSVLADSDRITSTSSTTQKNFDDEKNNNTRHDINESDNEEEKQEHQKLAVEKVMRRRKSPSRVNNNNIKNNNRMSYPMGRSEIVMTKSSDKIDGKGNTNGVLCGKFSENHYF